MAIHSCRVVETTKKHQKSQYLNVLNHETEEERKYVVFASNSIIQENMTFSFTVSAKETIKVRLEYVMGYVKADGRLSRKIFQISEILLKANQKKTYIKKHFFSDSRIRKHYPGTHSVTLIVNGAEQDTLDFELII